MADIITAARAQRHPTLANLDTQRLADLISAASVMINAKYTMPVPVSEDIQEACVLFIVHLAQEASAETERLGAWSISSSSGSSDFPSLVTKMLYPYKTPGLAPAIVSVDLSANDE